MKYYCENCGHMSDFGDFCLECESPNMISVYQSKKNQKAGNCRGIANRFEQNDRRLAKNVAANHGDNPEEMKITLGGFYYTKYGEYDVNYHVNGSDGSGKLAEIEISPRDIFPECREPHRLAIAELDRILKTHYKMEKILRMFVETCDSFSEELKPFLAQAKEVLGVEK